jgi:hypothetical protein
LAAGIIDELIDSTVVIDRMCQPPDSFSIMAHMPIPPFYALSDYGRRFLMLLGIELPPESVESEVAEVFQ